MAAKKDNVPIRTDEDLLLAYQAAFQTNKKSIIKTTWEHQDLFVSRDLAELKTFTESERRVITDVGEKVMEKCLDELLRMKDLEKFNKFVRVLFEQFPEVAKKAFDFVEKLPPTLCPPYVAYKGRVKARKDDVKISHVLLIVSETEDFNRIDKSFKKCCEKSYQYQPIYGEDCCYMLQKSNEHKIFVWLLRLWRLHELDVAMEFYPARIVIMCASCLDSRLPYMESDGNLLCSGDCVLMERKHTPGRESETHFRTAELKLWNVLEIDHKLASFYSSEWTVPSDWRPVTVLQQGAGYNGPSTLLCPFSRAPPTHPRLHFSSVLPPVTEVTEKWLNYFHKVLPLKDLVFFELVLLNSSSHNEIRAFPTILQEIIQYFFFESKKSD